MRLELIYFLKAAFCLQLFSNKLKIMVAGSWSDQPWNTSHFFSLLFFSLPCIQPRMRVEKNLPITRFFEFVAAITAVLPLTPLSPSCRHRHCRLSATATLIHFFHSCCRVAASAAATPHLRCRRGCHFSDPLLLSCRHRTTAPPLPSFRCR